jgi:hypothetical protein
MSFESPALIAQELSFQLSPIILVGGIAQLIPGQMLPIIAITEAINFTTGLLSGGDNVNTDNFFASFAPMAGGKLIDIQVAAVPFANQAVAANAVIKMPLRVSLKMTAPARGPFGFAAKFGTITAMKAALDQHTSTGGTFTVATPAYIYPNGLLTGLTDVTAGQPSQPQTLWQWDFFFPLLTSDQLSGAMNSMMSQISNGLPSTGALSGGAQAVGSPLSLAAPSVSPSASSLAGTNIATGN